MSNIDHPAHYNLHPSGIECIEVVEHFNFNVGNAIKYLWRAEHRDFQLEDLQKARWYIDREIDRLEQADNHEIVNWSNYRSPNDSA